MTARFGQGYGGMGYGPMGYGSQPSGTATSPFCPTCGFQGGYPTMGMTQPQFMGGTMPFYGSQGYGVGPGFPGFMPSYPSFAQGYPWSTQGYPWSTQGYPWFAQGYPWFTPSYYQGMTVPDDEQVREMIYDSIDADPLVPYDSDINVEVTGGLVTLTGTVPNKRVKHALGDDAWWIPGVWDVNNQIEIAGRARTRAERPGERMATPRKAERPPETPSGRMPTPPTRRPRRTGEQA